MFIRLKLASPPSNLFELRPTHNAPLSVMALLVKNPYNRVTMAIALIYSQWHSDLVTMAVDSCKETLIEHDNSPSDIHVFSVPGALEIPLFAQKAIETGRFDAVIAFGLVVDGGIYRHEFVAQAILDGFMRVQLDTGKPIFSCVLTPQAFHEHNDHQSFFKAHLVKKGHEAANAYLEFKRALNLL